MNLLQVKNLKKLYKTRFGGNQVEALSGVSFTVQPGEYTAIMGESGSGKTTLLNILASLDIPTEGTVMLNGKSYAEIQDEEMSAFRRDNLGFVFQDFNLLDTFSIKDNILLPLVLSNRQKKEMKQRLMPLVEKLGIENLLEKYPYEVSGGQKQRAAVARALITQPSLILADEPTGALDSHSSEELLNLFSAFNSEGQTIIMVTHSVQAAARAKRVMFLKDGKIICELSKKFAEEDMTEQIFDVLSTMGKGGRM
ncbi:ABC transporter ATP-binding protein [Bacillus sp. OK048]|uniref:ABC transporter ATP-binding protein n=1 Tax=Bacillus sp. OK048 TaxID=1882761 RepID=UPI0008828362|nr:ABC transporter ATP-binding protein [Bacillus sp. OK048]SDN57459.1 putative ABC transport system ATP-binding protein [Bacillus sp. OK048]